MRIPEPVTVRTVGATRANMLVIAIAYAIFAVSLLFQPARWSRTPAYHDLLVIMPQAAWGAVFAVVALLLAAAVWYHTRRLSVAALSTALAVTTCWFAGFVVRWATSSATTPETWVSWAVFDFVLLRALTLLGYEEVRVPAPPPQGGGRGD